MIGAALGYNQLTVIVAVFESREVAETKLLEWGCVRKEYPNVKWEKGKRIETGGTHFSIETTEAFAEYFSSKGFSMYSCGASFGEGWGFVFLPITLNEPCSGYNDD